MSNYEANPVGFLYERYQSSGVSPLYNVEMVHGQAHAPIFQVFIEFRKFNSMKVNLIGYTHCS